MCKAAAAAVFAALILCGCSAAPTEPTADLVPVQADVVQTSADTQRAEAVAFAETWAASVLDYPAEVQVLLAHEQLCRGCGYDISAENRHSAYGALIEGSAVCDGYAEGFAMLMDAVGIPAMTVIGTACGADGIQMAHAWNLVHLDGVWYHVDCTWDDTEDSVQHTYFLCDDAFMMQTHDWAVHKYPSAAGSEYRYETIVQGMMQAAVSGDQSSLG